MKVRNPSDPAGWVSIATIGPPGPIGPEGIAGPPGPAGEKWFIGTGAPNISSPAAAAIGDLYLDDTPSGSPGAGDYYEKMQAADPGSWELRGNLQGVDGETGVSSIIVGDFGAQTTPADLPPDGLLPVDWDGPGNPAVAFQMQPGWSLYYDKPTDPLDGHLFQYISTGIDPTGWLDIGLIQGPPGVDGPPGTPGEKWFTGDTPPLGSLAGPILGDWYLEAPTGDYYEKTDPADQTAAAWTWRGNLKGPPDDEVWVGPDTPPEPTMELWFDTDDDRLLGATDLPPGGTAGQPLVKTTDIDGDVGWDAASLNVSHGINVHGTNMGIVWPDGGMSRIYERDGYFVIRKGTSNTQPKVHNNDGSNQTDILTANGFASMTHPLKMGTFLGPKIKLYDSSPNEFGIGLESGQIVFYVPAANKFSFRAENTTGAEWVKIEGGSIHVISDGDGIFFQSGAGIYKKSGTGIVIREASGGQQPQIEDNGGGNAREILDALNGVKKSGDTMTGNLTISGTNLGINWPGGSRIYASSDKAMRINEDSAGRQPQIANNDGLGMRDIIDTVNGDARYVSRAQTYGASVYAKSLTINGIAAGLYLVEWGCTLVSPGDDWWSTELKMDGTSLGLNTAWSGGGHYWSGIMINQANIAAGNHTFTVGGQATNGMGGNDLFTVKLTPTA